MTEAEKKVSDDVAKMDLYGILGVEVQATEKAIIKAYRKKALKCHPDKNPDNPAAVALFHQLSKALEILTDKPARIVYDKIIKARLAAELRTRELDSKRRKLKEDLEARERNAGANQVNDNKTATNNLKAEIDRLRKEGSRLLQEEQERLKRRLQDDQESDSDEDSQPSRLKMKWKANKGDASNGGYSRDSLLKILTKYGDVNALLISGKKNGSAIVEFETSLGAQLAFENEKGLVSNPVMFTWISGQPKPSDSLASKSAAKSSYDFTKTTTVSGTPSFGSDMVSGFSFNSSDPSSGQNGSSKGHQGHGTASGDTDFESLVLMRMRQAQERKRLAEEVLEEDENTTEK